MTNTHVNIISIDDVVQALRDNMAVPTDYALTFASNLTGISIDKLMELVGDMPEESEEVRVNREVMEMEAHNRHMLRCYDSDLRMKAEEMMEEGKLDEDCIIPTSEEFAHDLSKCDPYMEAYWECMEDLIRRANHKADNDGSGRLVLVSRDNKPATLMPFDGIVEGDVVYVGRTAYRVTENAFRHGEITDGRWAICAALGTEPEETARIFFAEDLDVVIPYAADDEDESMYES